MKFICIGKNYSEHIKEMGAEKPSEPVIFIKPDSSLIQKNNPFIIPSFSNKIHYEIEVLVLINKLSSYHLKLYFLYIIMKLVIDNREKKIIDELMLREHNTFECKVLDIGDIHICDESNNIVLIIERKTISDL